MIWDTLIFTTNLLLLIPSVNLNSDSFQLTVPIKKQADLTCFPGEVIAILMHKELATLCLKSFSGLIGILFEIFDNNGSEYASMPHDSNGRQASDGIHTEGEVYGDVARVDGVLCSIDLEKMSQVEIRQLIQNNNQPNVRNEIFLTDEQTESEAIDNNSIREHQERQHTLEIFEADSHGLRYPTFDQRNLQEGLNIGNNNEMGHDEDNDRVLLVEDSYNEDDNDSVNNDDEEEEEEENNELPLQVAQRQDTAQVLTSIKFSIRQMHL